jgi:biopolymer transport protein ExbB
MMRVDIETRRGRCSRRRRLCEAFVLPVFGFILGAGIALAQEPATAEAPAARTPAAVDPATPPAPVEAESSANAATSGQVAPGAAGPSDRVATDVVASDAGPAASKSDAFLPSALPHDLTPWGMFRNADPIVQVVMMGLAFASVVTWTVWLAKSIELWFSGRTARRALETLAKSATLRQAAGELQGSRAPVALLVSAAMSEADRSQGLESEGVKERTSVLLSRIEARAGRVMTRGTGVLATIGATAPFVGLFGTVWGIMNSFIGISRTNTTNLAVVAPGIAEALLATALGLVAAIPAVVIYNAFSRSIAGYRAVLGDSTAEVLRHLSRDLDRAASDHEAGSKVVPMRQMAE